MAWLCVLVVANLAAGASASASASQPLLESDVSQASRHDGTPIDYYLEMVSNEHPSNTLLVFFQGSDCNSVAHNRFMRELSHAILPNADLLLIEKPGITASLAHDTNGDRQDCPRYYIEIDSIEQRTSDAVAVLSQVNNSHMYARIIVMGGSEGAVVAALLSAQHDIANAVVMLNGGGRWFIDDVTHNIKSTTPASDVDEVLAGFKGFAEHVLTSEPFELEVSNHGYTWWRSTLSLDQQSVLKQIRMPVLVVQGGQDQSVSPDGVKAMLRDLQDLGNSHIELKWFPEMNHGLFDADGRRMTDEVADQVSDWLESVRVQR